MNAAVATALRDATGRIDETSDTARLDAELLMAHALGVTRSNMLLGIGRSDWEVPAVFSQYVDRRALCEPIAYIVGHQEFYGREFIVTPDTLIPRGDSESLIEAAMELELSATRVLDLGTGSGALLITALLELDGATGVATDISEPALVIAQKNSDRHGLSQGKATFELRDWRALDWEHELGQFDLILCNPPYVEQDAQLAPNVRDFEPHSALFSGPDGLDDYRILIPQIEALLNPGGYAIFEIGAAQSDAVGAMAQAAGFQSVMRRDLAGRPRVIVLNK